MRERQLPELIGAAGLRTPNLIHNIQNLLFGGAAWAQLCTLGNVSVGTVQEP
jgi:hypothetical protein